MLRVNKYVSFWLTIQYILSILVISGISYVGIQNRLTGKMTQIQKDIRYRNGLWDVSLYNSDPLLLEKSPLYFVTTDGFVIDRRSPIHGFLDTTDFKRLLTYQKAQTIASITGQIRRVVAKPLYDKNTIVGVVAVSYFNPQEEILGKIDNRLNDILTQITSQILINKSEIDVRRVDERKVPTDIAYTIVDKYNVILKKTSNLSSIKRIPGFVDASYVKKQLKAPEYSLFKDTETGEVYSIKKIVLKDNTGIPIGILIVAQSIAPLVALSIQYTIVAGVLSVFLMFISTLQSHQLALNNNTQSPRSNPKKIGFNSTESILIIDNTRVKVTYATNQYFLLKALFTKPTKRWETDELLQKFGEESTTDNWRKIYDAMVKINKKVELYTKSKLIVTQNKTYQINPDLLSAILPS